MLNAFIGKYVFFSEKEERKSCKNDEKGVVTCNIFNYLENGDTMQIDIGHCVQR